MSDHVIAVSSQDFERQVLAASQHMPVLVDFWAPWCQPCRALGPVLERLAAEYAGRIRVVKVNSDENQALSSRLSVRSIPTVKAFVAGELVDEFTGAQPEGEVRAFIERLLPSPAEPYRQAAREAMAAGDRATAMEMLRQAIQVDPQSEDAWFDLAEFFLTVGELDQAKKLLERLVATGAGGETSPNRGRLEALQAKLELLSKVDDTAGPADEQQLALEARIDADPADLAARLELANLLAARQQFEPAMAQFLEVVKRDRTFDEDGGRKGLINLFTALGSGDPRVRQYRSLLAATLNC